MKEDYGNVAVVRPLVDDTVVFRSRKQKKPVRKGLPFGEKLLYLFSVIFCVLLAFAVLSQLVTISALNVEITQIGHKMQQTERMNLKLEMDKRKLESIERMRQYAKSKGMELKPQKILPAVEPSSNIGIKQ
jgi:cell division protein FtsL